MIYTSTPFISAAAAEQRSIRPDSNRVCVKAFRTHTRNVRCLLLSALGNHAALSLASFFFFFLILREGTVTRYVDFLVADLKNTREGSQQRTDRDMVTSHLQVVQRERDRKRLSFEQQQFNFKQIHLLVENITNMFLCINHTLTKSLPVLTKILGSILRLLIRCRSPEVYNWSRVEPHCRYHTSPTSFIPSGQNQITRPTVMMPPALMLQWAEPVFGSKSTKKFNLVLFQP